MGKSCETGFGLAFQRDFDANLKRGHADYTGKDQTIKA